MAGLAQGLARKLPEGQNTGASSTERQNESQGQEGTKPEASTNAKAANETPTETETFRTYVFEVKETIRFRDEVEVQAPTFEEARMLAFDKYYASVKGPHRDWDKSSYVTIDAIPLRGLEAEEEESWQDSVHEERLGNAKHALSIYRDPDQNANVTDLMTDLKHWCSSNGVDFEQCMNKSRDASRGRARRIDE